MGILSEYFTFKVEAIEIIRYTRMIASIMGALFLLLIWFNTRNRPKAQRSDFGYLFTVLAFIAWIIVDLNYLDEREFITDRGKKVWSTANNFFLLMSIPYYVHAFPFFKNKYKPKYISYCIGLIGIATAAILYFLWDAENEKLFFDLDLAMTTVTYSLLCFTIARSFKKRDYGVPIILLSILTFIILIDTQGVLRSADINFRYILYLCSQIGFIVIIILHATSWKEEVIKNSLIDELYEVKNGLDKRIEETIRRSESLTETLSLKNEQVDHLQGLLKEVTNNQEQLNTTILLKEERINKLKAQLAKAISKQEQLTTNLLFKNDKIDSLKVQLEKTASKQKELNDILIRENNKISQLEITITKLTAHKEDEWQRRMTHLKDRERELLNYIELPNSQIAENLHIGITTVNSHIENIKRSLGVKTKEEIIQFISKK